MKLGDALIADLDLIVGYWYDKWRKSDKPYPEINEAALKDHLPAQLRLIGEQLRKLPAAESPQSLWQVAERLDPEARVLQEIPIEEVVQEYGIAVSIIREWICDRALGVSFEEYSYLYEAMYELTAETVRRYALYQAQQVAKDRAQYLAGLTHQMRSPLTTLSIQLQLLKREDCLPPPALERLMRNVERLTFLINGVMRLERFKLEELPVSFRRIRPAQLIDQILNDRQLDAKQKGLRLEAHADRALEMELDVNLFFDILGNLVDNAIKYTHEGFVRVVAEEEPGHVVFKVLDSGPGIPEGRKKGLFETVLPSQDGGLGIGLHIAYRAVRAQQGELGVENEPGEGSLFWFRLPKVALAEQAESPRTR